MQLDTEDTVDTRTRTHSRRAPPGPFALLVDQLGLSWAVQRTPIRSHSRTPTNRWPPAALRSRRRTLYNILYLNSSRSGTRTRTGGADPGGQHALQSRIWYIRRGGEPRLRPTHRHSWLDVGVRMQTDRRDSRTLRHLSMPFVPFERCAVQLRAASSWRTRRLALARPAGR